MEERAVGEMFLFLGKLSLELRKGIIIYFLWMSWNFCLRMLDFRFRSFFIWIRQVRSLKVGNKQTIVDPSSKKVFLNRKKKLTPSIGSAFLFILDYFPRLVSPFIASSTSTGTIHTVVFDWSELMSLID